MVSGLHDVNYTIGLINLKNLVEQHKTLRQSAAVLCSVLVVQHVGILQVASVVVGLLCISRPYQITSTDYFFYCNMIAYHIAVEEIIC